MDTLNLPAYAARLREHSGRREIFDEVRRKFVRLTPEEWVRQHFVQFLIRQQGVPEGLVAIEMGFADHELRRRADVVVFDRTGRPLLMVECKAPTVEIRQDVFDQVARYNRAVQARYLIVTNGHAHFCYVPDYDAGTYRFLDALPRYEELV